MELDFRLYNCDRTYSLEKVEALIAKVSPNAKVKQHYFPLPRMSELCNELNEEGTFSGYAVFVVHAHESRLSINEANAGIGYAKLYRTLLKITDGRVLIVIGGDNNYKGQDQDDAFLSQWAWRKICSQFTEDDMDGTKSLIFSWDEDHRPIHEEALEFYLDPNRKGKFVPKPKPKPKPAAVVPAPTAGYKDTKSDLYSSKYHHQYSQNPPDGKGTIVMGAHDDRAAVKGRKPYSSQTSNQTPSLSQEQKSHPLDGRDHHAIGPSEQFPPGNNAGRPLPAAPKQSDSFRNDGATMPLSSESLMDVDGPPSLKTEQKRDFPPMVHVVSFLPQSEEKVNTILNNPVMDLIGDVFYSLNIPWAPHVPDIKPQDLPKHVQDTSPDLVVLLSEYDVITDVKDVQYQLTLFKNLFKSIEKEEGTKLVIVVTGDTSQRQDKTLVKSSETVEKEVKAINNKISSHTQFTILSWNRYPCTIHREALEDLIRAHKTRKIQQKLLSPEHDVHKGRSRCKAVIQNWRGLAILEKEPCDWSPSDGRFLSEQMVKYSERTVVEWWDDKGSIRVRVSTSPILLCKVVEISSTERRHSLQFYAYHSDKRRFGAVKTFMEGLAVDLGSDIVPSNAEIKGTDMMIHNIASQQPDFVAFSLDMEMLNDFQSIQDYVREYYPMVKGVLGNLKGIIIMVIGDVNCQDRDPVSEKVRQLVRQLESSIKLEANMITVLSWREKPFIQHQDIVKKLLIKAQSAKQQYPSQHHPKTVFDKAKGYLRYRADLRNGKIAKVSVQIPPDWNPDPRDIIFFVEKYAEVPRAVVEYWAHNLDNPITGAPLVTIEPEKSKSWLPNFLRRKSTDDGDYV